MSRNYAQDEELLMQIALLIAAKKVVSDTTVPHRVREAAARFLERHDGDMFKN